MNVSAEMAVRFEKMGWGEVEGWLQLPLNYELSRVRKRAHRIRVRPL